MNAVRKVICTFVLVLIGICFLGKVQNVEAASVSKQLNRFSKTQKEQLKEKIHKLEEWADKDDWWFSLVYIDGDDVPEILFRHDSTHGLFYLHENEIIDLWYSEWTDLAYIPKRGLVKESRYSKYGDSTQYRVFSIPDKDEKTLELYEKEKKKYGEESEPYSLEINIQDFWIYLGYPELSYDIFQKADLNGDGKEESIGIKTTQLENGGVKAGIYINNKLKYEEVIGWSDGIWIDIIDINPKDSFKEIEISSEYGHGEQEYYVYRFKKKELTKLFHSDFAYITNEKNNDTVTAFETSQSRLGMFGFYRDCKIEKGTLVPVKKQGVFACRPDWFTAAQNIVVYKKNMKTVVKTLSQGDKFQVTKVKVAYDSETKSSKIKYAYIDTVSKKGAGWINIEGAVWFESDDPLVSDWYAWH